MFVDFVEFFLKGLACLGTGFILLWIVRWESISYTTSIRRSGGSSSFVFYMMKLFYRNHFFNRKNIKWLYMIAFLSLSGSFLQFAVFPLCENIFWQGREIFTEYYRTEIGLMIVPIVIIINHIFVEIIKNCRAHHQQKVHIISRLSQFISSLGILFIILLSLFITYDSFDFHEIVRKQNSFFEYGLFLQPVAAILFFGCIQIEGNAKLFSISEKNYYSDLDGVEVFFLKLLEKTRWLCFITLYVFVFLGGYSLIPGMNNIVEIFTNFLHVGQFVSLVLKISFVAFVAIIVRNSFLENREIDTAQMAFKKLIPMAFINFVVTVGIKIYQG